MEDKLSSAAELPYFEGDFWPNVLEESIKELDQEEEEKRKQAEAAEAAANVSIFTYGDFFLKRRWKIGFERLNLASKDSTRMVGPPCCDLSSKASLKKILRMIIYFFPQVYSLSDDAGEGSLDGKKKGQKKAKKSNKSKANQRKNSKKSNTPQTGNDLSAKIFATMEKHKEVFFVIRLHSAQSAASLAVSFQKFYSNPILNFLIF